MALSTFEFDVNDFSDRFSKDSQLWVEFFAGSVKNEAKSLDAGRPIHDDADFIRIVIPGDKNNQPVRPVQEDDIRRWPKQYEQYKRGQSQEIAGQPLESWPPITKAQVEEFRYLGVRTVEHMADLRDDVVSKVPGAQRLKQLAKATVEAGRASAPLQKLEAELEAERTKNAANENAIAEQGKMLAQMREQLEKAWIKPKPKPRGRPFKKKEPAPTPVEA